MEQDQLSHMHLPKFKPIYLIPETPGEV